MGRTKRSAAAASTLPDRLKALLQRFAQLPDARRKASFIRSSSDRDYTNELSNNANMRAHAFSACS